MAGKDEAAILVQIQQLTKVNVDKSLVKGQQSTKVNVGGLFLFYRSVENNISSEKLMFE